MSRRVAIVGARGYVGTELIGLLARDLDFDIAFATSRETPGVRKIAGFDVEFLQMNPEQVADQHCDAVVLGLPNGLSAPYVDALEERSTGTVIVDLSTDHRHKDGWTYGLPDIGRDALRGATRIANPGCYATAAILGLWPIRQLINSVPSVIGMSGYSGAGTSPSDKNDPDRLKDNILPYAFASHPHQAEISRAIGQAVVFAPHVMPFFRGLIATMTAPVARGTDEASLRELYRNAYATSKVVRVQGDPPEPAMVAGTTSAVIGGLAYHESVSMVTVSCALDNLLKGAASQAHENLRLAFGLEHEL